MALILACFARERHVGLAELAQLISLPIKNDDRGAVRMLTLARRSIHDLPVNFGARVPICARRRV